MDREEQITKAALETYSGAVCGHLPMRVGFTMGAQWADSHPVRDTDKELDEAACKYFDKGFQDAKVNFINKASMWLKCNASKFVYNSSHSGEAMINESKLAEEFVKAMEG